MKRTNRFGKAWFEDPASPAPPPAAPAPAPPAAPAAPAADPAASSSVQKDEILAVLREFEAEKARAAAEKAAEKDEAAKLKKMTDQEKIAYLTQKVEQMERAGEAAKQASWVRETLQKDSYALSDRSVMCLVGETAEETKANVEAMIADIKQICAAYVHGLQSGGTPKTGAASAEMTLDQIMNEPDDLKRIALLREHKDAK